MTHFSMTKIKIKMTFLTRFLPTMCILCVDEVDGWRENVIVVYAEKCSSGLWWLICCFLVLPFTFLMTAGVVTCSVLLLHSSQAGLAVLCVKQEQAGIHWPAENGFPFFGRHLGVQSYYATAPSASFFCMSAPGTPTWVFHLNGDFVTTLWTPD